MGAIVVISKVRSRGLPSASAPGAPSAGTDAELLVEPPREGARRGEPEQLADVCHRVSVVGEVVLGQARPCRAQHGAERLALLREVTVESPSVHTERARDVVHGALAEGQQELDELLDPVARG